VPDTACTETQPGTNWTSPTLDGLWCRALEARKGSTQALVVVLKRSLVASWKVVAIQDRARPGLFPDNQELNFCLALKFPAEKFDRATRHSGTRDTQKTNINPFKSAAGNPLDLGKAPQTMDPTGQGH
jgi:hypothetical protein